MAEAIPILAPIPKAVALSGLSRSEIYRKLTDGRIKAVKSGRSTLIDMASLQDYIATLPQATFRAPRAA